MPKIMHMAKKAKKARVRKPRKSRPKRPVKSPSRGKPSRAKREKESKKEERASRTVEQGLEEFGKEMGSIGKRFEHHGRVFGERMEKKGRKMESSWDRNLGIVGPFISGIIGLAVLAIALWVLNLINIPLGSAFITSVYDFVFANLPLFFGFFLFFSYASYVSRRHKHAFMPISPITTAICITIAFWIIMSALSLINARIGNQYLDFIAMSGQQNLAGVFIFFLIIGYIVLFVGTLSGKIDFGRDEEFEAKEPAIDNQSGKGTAAAPGRQEAGMKRLYRSGKGRILGGVCGGIGEYLGVDPVIIRLIWVIFTLTYGAGILAYIIAWIIIPRNPGDAKHWD